MLTDLQVGLGEILREQLIEVGVVLLQFLASVTPVVLAIGVRHLGIHVEPVLHGLGEVFFLIGDAIGVVEDSTGLRLLVERLQTGVEGGVDLDDADAMNGVGKLMDEDVLGMVFINLVGQHVLFGARRQWLFDGAAQSTGSQVPVQRGVVHKIVMLGQVGSTFVASHDGHAGVRLLHRLENLRAQHRGHRIEGSMGSHEGRIGHTPR